MKNAYTNFGTKRTPQGQPIPGKAQVENNAGGYVFETGIWGQLERFLILGSEGGTYYVGEAKLTDENGRVIMTCAKEDGARTVDTIVDVSERGRAVSNDPALFALAICASADDLETRKYALANLRRVARIFTHLAHFLTYVQNFRGWGRALREAVSDWYNFKPAGKLAYQMVKYRQRDGWTQGDVLKKAHPNPPTADHDFLYGWALGKRDASTIVESIINIKDSGHPLELVGAYELAKDCENVDEILPIIQNHGLTREMIPTQFMKDARIWEALFNDGKMPMHALIRNLGNMTKCGFIDEAKFTDRAIAEAITDQERIRKSRLHPLAILTAMKVYESGGNLGWGAGEWTPSQKVVNALDEAFYLSFENVEPSGQRILLACDVSGSMSIQISGSDWITCAEAVGALALITASTEPNSIIRGFSHQFVNLGIDPRQRLTDVVRKMRHMNFGRTDCALPMLWALENEVELDSFVILTDNETWAGNIHPVQALNEYRAKINPDAKLVVVGMASTGFTIADPADPNSLDVVGFDTSTPSAISEFIR